MVMNFNPAPPPPPKNKWTNTMARFEIFGRLSLPDALWWRFMPGEEIVVPWPTGEVRIRQEESGTWDSVRSADPNDHYRPWLEANVGRQGWDWQWRHRIVTTMYSPGYEDEMITGDKVVIKFRWGKERQAMLANLMWT
jgi:hypothetical protein